MEKRDAIIFREESNFSKLLGFILSQTRRGDDYILLIVKPVSRKKCSIF